MKPVQGGYRSEQHVRCANHEETAALTKCCRCRSPLCDPCASFVINQDVWCEPCGAGVVDETKVPWGKVVAVVAIGLPLVMAVWLSPIFIGADRTMPLYIPLGGAAAVIGIATKIARTTAGEAPMVSRRLPGRPLPSAAKRLL
jgi:hypothetical protein